MAKRKKTSWPKTALRWLEHIHLADWVCDTAQKLFRFKFVGSIVTGALAVVTSVLGFIRHEPPWRLAIEFVLSAIAGCGALVSVISIYRIVTRPDIQGEILEYHPQPAWTTTPDYTSAALLKVSLVNHSHVPVGIKKWNLELIKADGSVYEATEVISSENWSKVQTVPHFGKFGGTATTSKLENLKDLRDIVSEKRLEQGAPVEGWLAFAFKDAGVGTFDARPRLILIDAFDYRHVIEGVDSYKGKNVTGLVDTNGV